MEPVSELINNSQETLAANPGTGTDKFVSNVQPDLSSGMVSALELIPIVLLGVAMVPVLLVSKVSHFLMAPAFDPTTKDQGTMDANPGTGIGRYAWNALTGLF